MLMKNHLHILFIMCESKIVLISDGKEKTMMEAAALVKINGGEVVCTDISGEEIVLKDVRIEEINFLRHELRLESED